ncbi:DUF2637 domain-containing protein [Micromonospora tulbaghiae]|uniref:DUF2637 domain-containing protein n=1 Tax=Micromonospora tulbaghiae TaxID=479978 RepID=UPI00340DC432
MTARRVASLAGTVAVTVIVAVASYDHMRELAEHAGQPPLLAALLPLSVDGMILVATLALGDGRRSRWSAWLAFVLGVAASLAANVIVAPPDTTARVVSAWPAVALLLTVEILARSGRAAEAVAETVPAAEAVPVSPAPAPVLVAPSVADNGRADDGRGDVSAAPVADGTPEPVAPPRPKATPRRRRVSRPPPRSGPPPVTLARRPPVSPPPSASA